MSYPESHAFEMEMRSPSAGLQERSLGNLACEGHDRTGRRAALWNERNRR